jgi:DNA-binding CsgD family transcriptional regulator/tetratricopeptide (TPR) repeat protein
VNDHAEAPTRQARLHGRQLERDLIGAVLSEANTTQAGLLLVGEAGIGKSALALFAADAARERGFRVLRAAGGAVERTLPYMALADLLRHDADELRALPAPQVRALDGVLLRTDRSEPLEPRAVALSALGALEHLAVGGSLAIVLDDLHWIDRASGAALGFALRRLAAPRVALIGTQRPNARPPLDLRAAWPDARFREHIVDGLEPEALGELAVEWLGDRATVPILQRIIALSAGNPLIAIELARLHVDDLERLGALEADRLPYQVIRLIGDRLARLSPREARAVAHLALMPRPTQELLAALAIGTAELRAAQDAGVLRPQDGGWEFEHPLVRSAATSLLTRAERRAIHTRLASLATDPVERAGHIASAAPPPGEDPAATVEAGAREAARRGAPLEGARLADQAVVLTPAAHAAARFDRLLLAGNLRRDAADYPGAHAILQTALAAAPLGRRGEGLLALARVEANIDAPVAIERYRSALRAAVDPRRRATTHLELADLLRLSSQLPIARRHARQGVEAAARARDPALLAEALSMSGVLDFNAIGRIDEALIARVLDLAGAGPSADARATWAVTMLNVAHILVWAGRFERARSTLAKLAGAPSWSGGVRDRLWYLALADLWTGRWEDAATCLTEHWRITEWVGEYGNIDLPHLRTKAGVGALLAVVGAHLGDPRTLDRAQAALRTAEREGTSRYRTLAASAVGLWWLGQGDPAAAASALVGAVEVELRLEPAVPISTILFPDAIEALALSGKIVQARTLADEVRRRTRRWTAAPYRVALRRALAVLALAEGEPHRALSVLEARTDASDQPDMPFLRARTDLVRGRILRRLRQRSRARVALRRARDGFESLGSGPWVTLAARELDRIGDRPGEGGDLTATEARVADLAAEGRTNREIAEELYLTVKTVEWNLTRVYQKLGVRSRTELAAQAARSDSRRQFGAGPDEGARSQASSGVFPGALRGRHR